MTPKRIILVRHGRSEANEDGKYQLMEPMTKLLTDA